MSGWDNVKIWLTVIYTIALNILTFFVVLLVKLLNDKSMR